MFLLPSFNVTQNYDLIRFCHEYVLCKLWNFALDFVFFLYVCVLIDVSQVIDFVFYVINAYIFLELCEFILFIYYIPWKIVNNYRVMQSSLAFKSGRIVISWEFCFEDKCKRSFVSRSSRTESQNYFRRIGLATIIPDCCRQRFR